MVEWTWNSPGEGKPSFSCLHALREAGRGTIAVGSCHGASSWSGGPMLEQRWRRYGDSSTGEDGEDSRVEVG